MSEKKLEKFLRKGVSRDGKILTFIRDHLDCKYSEIVSELKDIASPATVSRRLVVLGKEGLIVKDQLRYRSKEQQNEIDLNWRQDLDLAKKGMQAKEAILNNTTVAVSPSFHFSNSAWEFFQEAVFSLLCECCFNNPDLWYGWTRPEDMHFSITINAHWEDDPRIFALMESFRDAAIQNKKRHYIGNSVFKRQPFLHDEERAKMEAELIKGLSAEDLATMALGQSKKREDEERKYAEAFPRLKEEYLVKFRQMAEGLEEGSELRRQVEGTIESIERGYIQLSEDGVKQFGLKEVENPPPPKKEIVDHETPDYLYESWSRRELLLACNQRGLSFSKAKSTPLKLYIEELRRADAVENGE